MCFHFWILWFQITSFGETGIYREWRSSTKCWGHTATGGGVQKQTSGKTGHVKEQKCKQSHLNNVGCFPYINELTGQ